MMHALVPILNWWRPMRLLHKARLAGTLLQSDVTSTAECLVECPQQQVHTPVMPCTEG
jgi:hypothetical protein